MIEWPMQPQFSHVRGCLRAYAPEPQVDTSTEALTKIEQRMMLLEEGLREIARGGYDETTCQMLAVAALNKEV